MNQPRAPSLAEITKPKADFEIKKFLTRISRPGNDLYGFYEGDILEIYNMVIYPSMKVMRSVRQIVRNVEIVRSISVMSG